MAIYGPTGSGKSTLGRLIGERLGLPFVELDGIFHRPGWEPTPTEEFRAAVQEELARNQDGWVVDGNYRSVRDLILPQADTVVWLRLPFRVVFPRLVGRTFGRAWSRELLWGTNRESWRKSLFTRESILLWSITSWRPHVRRTEQALEEMGHSASVFELRSPREVEALLADLGSRDHLRRML